MQVFVLPDLGEGLTEAEVVRWLVAPGDRVVVDQAVVEVETAKATVEVPTPFAGTVTTVHAAVGETVGVGRPLLSVAEVVAGPSSSGSAAAAGSGSGAAYPEEERAGSGAVLIGYGTGSSPAALRRHRRPRTRITTERLAEDPGRLRVVSPLVRRLAKEWGVDLRRVRGTGHGGLILRRDVERAAAADTAARSGHAALAAAAAPAAGPDAAASVNGTSAAAAFPAPVSRNGARADARHAAGDTRTAGSAAHRTAAVLAAGIETSASVGGGGNAASSVARTEAGARVALSATATAAAAVYERSRREIPEVTIWVDVDATALVELRESLRPGPGLIAYLARFTVSALRDFPVFNARFDAARREILPQPRVDLGLAVQGSRGLTIPAIANAEALTTTELDAEIRRLTAAAREGTAAPANGTFTLNNYGPFQIDGSTPILAPPNVAMLGIGRILDRPWVVGGAVVPRKIAQLSFVFDHRVCDGHTAAAFLRRVADAVENPAAAVARL